MKETTGIWTEQCEATKVIKQKFGLQKALGYLIGEKLLHFVQAAENSPELEEELPGLITEIKSVFQPWEILEYLENVKNIGAPGHILSDEEYEDFINAGAIPQNIDFVINDILTIGKIRELILG